MKNGMKVFGILVVTMVVLSPIVLARFSNGISSYDYQFFIFGDDTVAVPMLVFNTSLWESYMYMNETNIWYETPDGTNYSLLNSSVVDTDTHLTQEEVEDYVGSMVSGNTETGITVTYEDVDGTLDFVVDMVSSGSIFNGSIWTTDNNYFPLTNTGFQNACDDLTSGGIVFLPDCNISISTTIDINYDGISIVGSGYGTRLYLADSTNDEIMTNFGYSNFLISGVVFDGNGDNQASTSDGLRFDDEEDNIWNVTVRDCWFENIAGNMIEMYDGNGLYETSIWNVLIYNCNFDGVNYKSGYVGGCWLAGDYFRVLNNNFVDTRAFGVVFEDTDEANDDGAEFNWICNNHFSGTINRGIYIENSGSRDICKGKNIFILNNVIDGISDTIYNDVAGGYNTGTGILATSGCVVGNNKVYSIGGVNDIKGIMCYGGDNGVRSPIWVFNNEVYDITPSGGSYPEGVGIQIEDLDCFVYANNVTLCADQGMLIKSTDCEVYIDCFDNRIVDPAQDSNVGGIFIYQTGSYYTNGSVHNNYVSGAYYGIYIDADGMDVCDNIVVHSTNYGILNSGGNYIRNCNGNVVIDAVKGIYCNANGVYRDNWLEDCATLGIGLYAGDDNVTISDCTFYNCAKGIYISDCFYTSVTDCFFRDCTDGLQETGTSDYTFADGIDALFCTDGVDVDAGNSVLGDYRE